MFAAMYDMCYSEMADAKKVENTVHGVQWFCQVMHI